MIPAQTGQHRGATSAPPAGAGGSQQLPPVPASPPPLPCIWEGDGFKPISPYWQRVADQHFVVGQAYPLEVREARSSASHRQYFAAINEAWKNLPEDAAANFPTSEHLRKFALIRCGYRDERSVACASRAEAVRIAAFVAPMDDFAVVVPTGSVVTVYTAKSQSLRAMDKATFQRSKEDVLAYIADKIGVRPIELEPVA